MISMDKSGGRTVHLFIPFEYNGKKIESITLAPLRFGHSLRWAKGDWKEAVDFLVELAGVEDGVIRDLRYPDADRVMEAFLSLVTQDIRDDIANGRIPLKPTDPEERVKELQEALRQTEASMPTNGRGVPLDEQLLGPGAPLPPMETGFDLSDEQP